MSRRIVSKGENERRGRSGCLLDFELSPPLNGRISRFGHADDADREPAAGVASGLRFQVVCLLMDDQAAADDRVRTMKAQVGVFQVIDNVAAGAGLDVAQVADVPLGRFGRGVRLFRGVKVSAGSHTVFGPDAEFVDMKPVLAR